MEGPHWHLSEDKKTLTVEFPSTPPVALQYEADQVDSMLAMLRTMRSAMDPPVDNDLQIGKPINILRDPKWYTELEVMTQDTLFRILDPGFGWLNYVIPRQNAEKLAGLLNKQVNTPPGETPDKTN